MSIPSPTRVLVGYSGHLKRWRYAPGPICWQGDVDMGETPSAVGSVVVGFAVAASLQAQDARPAHFSSESRRKSARTAAMSFCLRGSSATIVLAKRLRR